MKRFLAIFLTLCLLAAVAACGGQAPAETSAPTPETPAETAAPTEAPAETSAPEETEAPTETEGGETAVTFDYIAGRAAHAEDETVLTMNGIDISWSLYADLVEVALYELNNYYGVTDLRSDAGDGMTVAEWICSWAENSFRSMTTLRAMAAEEGIALTEAELASIDEELTQQAEAYFDGDREALMEAMHISEALYRYEAESTLLYDKLFTARFGEKGADLPAEDAVNWAAEQGYLNAKHILWSYTTDSGESLDEEAKASVLAEAQALVEELRAAKPDELDQLFNDKMQALSADPGSAAYPDGYYFQAGEMVAEFENAARDLEAGQISDPVESSYGIHVLYRPPMSADHIAGYDNNGGSYTLRYLAASSLFETIANEAAENAELVYAPGFEDLDLATIYQTKAVG